MSAGSELSIMYHNHQYYNNTPHIISDQQYRIQSQQEHQAYTNSLNRLPQQSNKGFQHDHMISHLLITKYDDGNSGQHNNSRLHYHQQTSINNNFGVVSPLLSVASSSSTTSSSTNFNYNNTTSSNSSKSLLDSNNHNKSNNLNAKLLSMPTQPPTTKLSSSTTSNLLSSNNSTLSQTGHKRQSSTTTWNFTWLVFMNEKWVPFDIINQTKLEQTLTVGGTFVDITDSHFPDVKRVRVFPRNNYLSYLGVKYRLSRIMQPDAYLDHVAVAEAKQPSSSSTMPTLPNNNNNNEHSPSPKPHSVIMIASENNNRSDNNARNRRTWEI